LLFKRFSSLNQFTKTVELLKLQSCVKISNSVFKQEIPVNKKHKLRQKYINLNQ